MTRPLRRLLSARLPRRLFVAAAAVVLPLTDAQGCRLDSATVMHVPPSAVHYIAVYDCPWYQGSTALMRCWRRWTEQEGKRIGKDVGEACEDQRTDGGSRLTVPTRERPQPVVPVP